MMDTEDRWSLALANNNVRAILRWLRSLVAEGDAEVEEILATFSVWVQRMAEFAKKELLTLCFSRCQGLWMFLDQNSFTRVHLLLQRLRNLLTLAQWGRRQLKPTHLWHGLGVPCVVCRGGCGSAVGQGCWNRERRALKQHIWLGQLVQWWGITGLLPKYPEAQEMKRISQMWREMDHSHRKACLETPGLEEEGRERWNSLIQGMVAQVDKQHGPVWSSEDCTDQCYPPPNLQALLKLVFVPQIDNMSVQAILMYFIMDMAGFLQCKNDLLLSFCHAFTIPPSFSQQIRGFWLLDHGHVVGSMELLLSPRSAAPWLSWQHRCIIHSLLSRKQTLLALKYLHKITPAIESPQDLKICADVLLQNGRISDAWALLRKGRTGSDDMTRYFLQGCERLGLCAEASKCKSEGHSFQSGRAESQCGVESSPQLFRTTGTHATVKETGGPLRPFSAQLYQSRSINRLSSEDVIRLLRESVIELRQPPPRVSVQVVWLAECPAERRESCRDLCLAAQPLRHLLPSSTSLDMSVRLREQAHAEAPREDQSLITETLGIPKTALLLSSQSSSMGSSESVSSFASASSLPCLRWDRPYACESTATLQQISALLSDGRCHSRQDESRTPSADILHGCPDQTLTVEGAIDPISFNSLSKHDSVEELVFSTEWGVEEIMTCTSPGVDVLSVEGAEGPIEDQEHLTLDRRPRSRLNLPPQFYSNEDNQSVHSVSECPVESHNFLTPDYEKMYYYKGVSEETSNGPPNVIDMWSVMPTCSPEESIIPQTSLLTGAMTSHYFLDLEPLQVASYPPTGEEEVECFRRDFQDAVDQPEILTSCALTESTQDLLSDLQQSLCLQEQGDAGASSTETAKGPRLDSERYRKPYSIEDSSSMPILIHRAVRPKQLQTVPLSPMNSPNRTPQLSPSTPQITRGGKASPKKEAAYFRSTPDRLGHCKLGSWWKQALETRRASAGLLPAIVQVPTISQEKRGSPGPGRPYSHGIFTFPEPPAKQRGDKQAEKEEATSRRVPGKAPHQRAEQGVTDQRGARVKRGKRVKRA